jgi:hypothetical protein
VTLHLVPQVPSAIGRFPAEPLYCEKSRVTAGEKSVASLRCAVKPASGLYPYIWWKVAWLRLQVIFIPLTVVWELGVEATLLP